MSVIFLHRSRKYTEKIKIILYSINDFLVLNFTVDKYVTNNDAVKYKSWIYLLFHFHSKLNKSSRLIYISCNENMFYFLVLLIIVYLGDFWNFFYYSETNRTPSFYLLHWLFLGDRRRRCFREFLNLLQNISTKI